MNKLGLYIHVPFCVKKCGYCDFYSVTDSDSSAKEPYVQALLTQLQEESAKCKEYLVDSIYIGGGTPSVLDGRQIEKIMRQIGQYYRVSTEAEVTIEVNPSSVEENKLIAYHACGINRVSIGLQSAQDRELAQLGRLHDRAGFDRAYSLLRRYFHNVNIDIMFALPGQQMADLQKTLSAIADYAPEHVSAYCLKIEKNTPFASAGYTQPSEDEQFDMYQNIADRLRENLLEQYEISNYAKNGFASRHNLKYWKGEAYLGFGPAAYSYFEGIRYGLARDLGAYLQGEHFVIEKETISAAEAQKEKLLLGLRLAEGVPLAFLRSEKINKYVKTGYALIRDGNFCLTTKGFFVSNAIICDLID